MGVSKERLNDLLTGRIKDALLEISPEEILRGLVEEIDLPETVQILDKVAREEKKMVKLFTEEDV